MYTKEEFIDLYNNAVVKSGLASPPNEVVENAYTSFQKACVIVHDNDPNIKFVKMDGGVLGFEFVVFH